MLAAVAAEHEGSTRFGEVLEAPGVGEVRRHLPAAVEAGHDEETVGATHEGGGHDVVRGVGQAMARQRISPSPEAATAQVEPWSPET